MASNEKLIIERYGDGSREEGRGTGDRADYRMEFHYTKKLMDEYIGPDSVVVELGCGTGYYGMYLADHCKEYLGIDITPGNIDVFNGKIQNSDLRNVKACVGDATDLNALKEDSFDVVMVLGPMYHLPPDERELVFRESARICRPGGFVLFAYVNKVGVYAGACLRESSGYPNQQANAAILHKGIDPTRTDIYFFTMPEEMEEAAAGCGLRTEKNLGVDFSFYPKAFDGVSGAEQEAWAELFDFMCGSRSCTGFSNHALLVCQKAK